MSIKSKIGSYINDVIDKKNQKLISQYEQIIGRIEVLEKNIRNHNVMLEGYEDVITNIRNQNIMLEGYEDVITNIRNGNSLAEQLQSTVEMQKVKIAMLEKKIGKSTETETNNINNVSSVNEFHKSGNIYNGIDYFDFENYFRGPMERIRESQKQYLKYFEGYTNVIDIGCGRGEFLSLLKEKEIDAQGVDLYEEFAEMCKMKGLKVTCDDGIRFLKNQDEVGGIFAGQVIEHLSVEQVFELCKTAHTKLKEGASIVLETPNPTCLAIYTHAFYMDPSHQKPVHPLTMKYILEKAGFKKIDILYTETSKLPMSIPRLEAENVNNIDAFNETMQVVSDTLFGSQDYAIVGTKE